MRARLMVLPVVLLGLTGCATLDRGPMQRIAVSSDIEGAEVRTKRCGKYSTKVATTPAVVWVSRRATHCTLEVAAEGYLAEVVWLRRFKPESVSYLGLGELCGEELKNCNSLTDVVALAMFGALLFVPSLVVDSALGSMFEQDPRTVEVRFAEQNLQDEEPEP